MKPSVTIESSTSRYDFQNLAEYGMDECILNKEKYDLDVKPSLTFECVGAIQVNAIPKVYQRKE